MALFHGKPEVVGHVVVVVGRKTTSQVRDAGQTRQSQSSHSQMSFVPTVSPPGRCGAVRKYSGAYTVHNLHRQIRQLMDIQIIQIIQIIQVIQIIQ